MPPRLASTVEPRRNEAGQVLNRPNTTAAGQRYARARLITPTSTLVDLARRFAMISLATREPANR